MTAKTPINYIEIPVTDMNAQKAFFADVFGWAFQDYGPTYAAFTNAGIDGGFDASPERPPANVGALVVLYEKDIEACLVRVKASGAKISKPLFSFPGGQRFHFMDPSGNDLAVWSDTGETAETPT